MSDAQTRRLEAWVQVGLLVFAIAAHALTLEDRLAKLEQRVEDLATYVKSR